MLGPIIPTSTTMMCPNIEVMCMVRFQYAISGWSSLPYDHCHVSYFFPNVSNIVINTAIPTSNFLFLIFNLTCMLKHTRLNRHIQFSYHRMNTYL